MTPKTPSRDASPGGAVSSKQAGRPASAWPVPATLAALLLTATSLPVLGQGVITQTEPDDSFGTAEVTGLTSTATGIKVAYGSNADGPYGYDGDGTGDFDFYKLNAAAGQTILVDLKNYSLNADFDSYVAVYTAAGVKVAENDDGNEGGRASNLTYTIPAGTPTGDYYVLVGNWINGPTNEPSDLNTPGTGPGLPGGTGGPYEVFIGVNANVPILQFDGGISPGNPVPTARWVRVTGGNGYKQTTTITAKNTGTASDVITAYSITGTDASKFTVTGPALPLTLPVGSSATFTINYTGSATQTSAQAKLSLTSNDPLNIAYPLILTNSLFKGGGTFSVKQVNATAAVTSVNSFAIADDLLAGNNVASTTTKTYSFINFSGQTPAGNFSGDVPFPNVANGADNFVTKSTGNIYVSTAGTYSFRGYSDDGDRLFVDGQELFETNTANVNTYGVIDLDPGIHTIEYTQFEGGGGDNAELSVSQHIGAFTSGTDSQTSWELLEAYSGDTDGDGLPDDWELAHGLNPNSATGNDGATGDPDSDGSTNLAEYAAGTDPQNPDTDGDGLKDGVETNTGVYVSATNTGTSPLKADTDGDGLSDAVEDPTKTSTGLTQPGTDPNKADTDGDGFNDLTEVIFGTDPKLASSFPTFNYQTLIADNFDGVATNSVYSITGTTGGFTPAITASNVAANNQALEIAAPATGQNNSIAWNQVPSSGPKAIQLTFDFRIDNATTTPPADGIGFGLFRTATYGTTGAANPANGKNWEDPSASGGLTDGVAFGMGLFPSATIHLSGPASPGTALVSTSPPFTITNALFNRAIFTGVTAGSSGTTFSLVIIEDVNGAAISHTIFTNVLVPGFDLPNESFRLIAGARTGLYYERMDLDNIKLAVSGGTASVSPTISIAKSGAAAPVITYTGVLQSSPDLINYTDVSGAVSPYTVPTTGTKMFFRSRTP